MVAKSFHNGIKRCGSLSRQKSMRKGTRSMRKNGRESLAALLDNLDTVIVGLNSGLKIEQVRTFGFTHSEPHGVFAIDQKGGHGQGLTQMRLYVYPDAHDPAGPVVHVIT